MTSSPDFLALRQEQFPVTERYIYLNHAALGPLPRRTADAITSFAADFRDRGVLAEQKWMPAIERTRALVARLLHAGTDDIAFTKNTSQGLNIVAESIPWRRGDVIVTVRGEFPSNVYPWLALRALGVQVRFVEPRGGHIMLEDVRQALRGARMLAISWVQYSSGFRIDLAAISALCREMKVLLSLDAIQGVGVVPLDLAATPVDFCAFGGQKWLLAPQGVGVLYVNPAVRDQLTPTNVGWLGIAWRDYTAFDYDSPLLEGAARYEEGTRSLVGLAGLEQSLQLVLTADLAAIQAHVTMLTGRLAGRLRERGYHIVTPLLATQRAGILTISHPQVPAQILFERLRVRRIVAAIREGGVRLSPHLYNTLDEMDAVVEALDQPAAAS